MNQLLEDPIFCVHWITRIMGLAALVSTLERLGIHRQYAAGGLLSWNSMSRKLPRLKTIGGIRILFGYPGFPIVLLVRSIAGAVLLIEPAEIWIVGPTLAVLFLTQAMHNVRDQGFATPICAQMLALINGALLVRVLAWESDLAAEAAIAFIAVNAALSYTFAAISKLRVEDWRSGIRLFHIFNSEFLGRRFLASLLLDRPRLTRALAWSVIGFQLAYPLALFAGLTVCWIFVVATFLFHLANLLIFRIQGFVLSYLATYPAMLYFSHRFQEWIH